MTTNQAQEIAEGFYVDSQGVRIYCTDSGGDGIPLVLMHGLTANLHSFDGYMNAGLGDHFRVIRMDLRGRGLSDSPDEYSMESHMNDLLAILAFFNLKKAMIGGHSFGALLSIYSSYFNPEVFEAMIIIDAAARLHPDARNMLIPTLSRIDKIWNSMEEYLAEMKSAEYLSGMWNTSLESYFKADVRYFENGSVTTCSRNDNIQKATESVFSIGLQWLNFIGGIQCPVLLINAPGPYQGGEALLPENFARETVDLIKNCEYLKVPGNHMTMMFELGAILSVDAIIHFIEKLSQ
ncbi:MAG TPA: alpha/beta hydrolase [Saprospiraceae bacterium]|nr:alpha/beta hydrolase [Saprospiraceae bacterium]